MVFTYTSRKQYLLVLLFVSSLSFTLAYETIEKRAIETVHGVDLIHTPKCLKIVLSVMSPSTAMSDFSFMTEYGYEQLSRYFFGNNYERATLAETTPMFVALDILDMSAPRDIFFTIPQDNSESPPAPRYPLYIKEVEEKYYFVSKINTTDFWGILHAAGDMLTDLSYERMPFKDTHVYIALYNYPPSADGSETPANEIWVERDISADAGFDTKV